MSLLARLVVLSVLLLPHTALANGKRPIKIVEGTTTQQKVVTAIAASALKKARFRAMMVSLTDAAAMTALAEGKVQVHLTMPAAFGGDGAVSLGGLGDNKPDAAVLKLVSPSMKRQWPYAQKMFKRMVIPPETVDALARQIDDGTPLKEAVAAWMKANTKTWRPWVAASTNWMKP